MIKNLFKKTIVSLLEIEARAVLRKYKPKIVAITGSVGKTSTKEAVYTALSRFYFVWKNYKNFNNEIGVPLTVLNLPSAGSNPFAWIKNLFNGLKLIILPSLYPEWLVLEVGGDHPGDIEKIANWIKPEIVVVTRLSEVPVHVEFFESPEQLFEEKAHLIKALKAGGTLILNADDKNVLNYKNLTKEKIVLFGHSSNSDLKSKDYSVVYDENNFPKGITFTVENSEESLPIYLPGTLGEHHILPCLAALAVCQSLGEHLSVAGNSFKKHEPTSGRMRIIEGMNESLIIDDTYNSSPIALDEALNTLKDLKNANRKIVVLGDMLELGKYSIDEHKKAGEKIGKFADMLVTVGVRARFIAEGAVESKMTENKIHQLDNSKEAGEYLKTIIEKGDVVLVKGSQGMRMERVVDQIMSHPEDKEKLLVRQDKEWSRR